MRKYLPSFLFCLFALTSPFGQAETCSSSSAQLKTDKNFKTFLEFIGDGERRGLLNETEGSYIWLESGGDNLHVTLFSSGFFDLFPIRRESELKICAAEDGTLYIEVFGQRHPLSFREGAMIIGSGGPKYRFKLAQMPAKLRALHKEFNP